jgi:hypothetical protein
MVPSGATPHYHHTAGKDLGHEDQLVYLWGSTTLKWSGTEKEKGQET